MGRHEAVIWTEVVQSVIQNADMVLVLIMAGCAAALPPSFTWPSGGTQSSASGALNRILPATRLGGFCCTGMLQGVNITNFVWTRTTCSAIIRLHGKGTANHFGFACIVCACFAPVFYHRQAVIYLLHQHTELLQQVREQLGHPSRAARQRRLYRQKQLC